MGYKKCPKCGSTKCQLTDRAKHLGGLWFFIFGIFWLMYKIFMWAIGFAIFLLFDWWYAIIKKRKKEVYYWRCKKWFIKRNTYYCTECGYNFKA